MSNKIYTHWDGKTVTSTTDQIKVKGHTGTWYVIDEAEYDGKTLFLLEHEEYGDEVACVIVDGNTKLILDDVWNGFDDYEDVCQMKVFINGNRNGYSPEQCGETMTVGEIIIQE